MTRILFPLVLLLLLAAPPAEAASPDLVVSQVFAAGGNAGASYANDYVELFNRGSSTVDLGGWSLQYAPATGTNWSATPLTGSIPPGRRYLVQFASSGAVGSAVPTADATGTTNLATTGGKVAIVHDTTTLTCGASAGSCSGVGVLRDLVGYGSATDFEGAVAPSVGATTAAIRDGGGCVDTDSNAADFSAGAPAPRNATAAATGCAGSAPTSSASATVDLDIRSIISLSLERSSVSFGSFAAGETPPAVSERVTVVSNNATGYWLGVRRATFTPADLPLAISASAPSNATLAAPLGAGAKVAIPTAADLLLGVTAAPSAAAGDAWQTSLSFLSPLPALAPGHYSASVVYTVVGL